MPPSTPAHCTLAALLCILLQAAAPRAAVIPPAQTPSVFPNATSTHRLPVALLGDEGRAAEEEGQTRRGKQKRGGHAGQVLPSPFTWQETNFSSFSPSGINSSRPRLQSPSGGHVVHQHLDFHHSAIAPPDTPSLGHGQDPLPHQLDVYLSDARDMDTVRVLSRERREARWAPLWVNWRRTLFVEVVVACDWSVYEHYDRDLATIEKRVRDIMNVANALLNRLGVVVTAGAEVWTGGDQISVTQNLNDVLTRFSNYRNTLNQRRPHDHTILLTGVLNPGNTKVGRANTMAICAGQNSASVVREVRDDAGQMGYLVAHEMGHSLGLRHIEDLSCSCQTKNCIMAATGYINPEPSDLVWSSCSQEFVEKAKKKDVYHCLQNFPDQVWSGLFVHGGAQAGTGGASCGDGVVQHPEQCDCGPKKFCTNNKCCDPDTCRLTLNATCASGPCCDPQTCRPRAAGTVCRAEHEECDLPEYCTGHSEYCASDVTKADGVACKDGKGRCYKGECASHEESCKKVWGPYASAAHAQCYAQINTLGHESEGSCGYEPSARKKYPPCAPESVMCGTLQCTSRYAPDWRSSGFTNRHYNYTKHVDGGYTCMYVGGSQYYPKSHWLSPDGVACGDGKMCVNQRCVSVDSGGGDCEGGCSGRGVCNSHGHCHCDPGYAPPHCSERGNGGSIDSGVTGDFSDTNLWVEIVLLVLSVLVLLLFVMCCMWGRVRSWWKRAGQTNVSRILPCCATCLDTCCCPLMNKTITWMLTVGYRRRQHQRTVASEGGANEAMICSVDVDIHNKQQTNSWGVADEKLMTDVITVTPKHSPDMRRKVMLPSHSPVHNRKSMSELEYRKYKQSISVDSGCVTEGDDETSSSKRSSLHMSMTSLISNLMKFTTKTTKTSQENVSQNAKTFGSQRSMPLSRFVVDPLAGNRRSRQGTPPPPSLRPAYQRSVSTEAHYTQRLKKSGTPPPPPANLKPHKSEDNLQQTTQSLTDNPFMQKQAQNKRISVDVIRAEVRHSSESAARRSRSPPPLVSPIRAAPPPPPPQFKKQKYEEKKPSLIKADKKPTPGGGGVQSTGRNQPVPKLGNFAAQQKGNNKQMGNQEPKKPSNNVSALARKFERL